MNVCVQYQQLSDTGRKNGYQIFTENAGSQIISCFVILCHTQHFKQVHSIKINFQHLSLLAYRQKTHTVKGI